MNSVRGVVAMAALAFGGQAALAADLLYVHKATAVLPSVNSDWDYVKVEPGSNRLFMARDKDGLTVFDMDANRAVATVENSVGANGPLLLPQYDRGYVAMTDGSLLSFTLGTLKPITRVTLSADGGLNSGMHDPSTKRVHFITSTREQGATWYSFDAASGRELGRKTFPFHKMDDPAADGRGHLFAPARYDELLLRLDSSTLAEQARWPIGCRVSKVRYQASTGRILGACTGDKPQFFALDPATGKVIARVPIGRGIDGFVIDETRRRIVTSNGEDGTLTVIGQDSADSYKLLGTIPTRIGARMMDLDPRTGRLFIVNADSTLTPAAAGGEETQTYHPDSFVVLTYEPR